MPSYRALCTLLLLPLSVLAGPIRNNTQTLPRSTNSDAVPGDTLSVTRCFCSSPNWVQDHTYGHYFLFDYHNGHLNRNYPIEDTCISNEIIYDKHNDAKFKANCLLAVHKVYCTKRDVDPHNTFCFIQRRFHKPEIKFNKQRRVLPNGPNMLTPIDEAETKCKALCANKVDGMDLLGGDPLRSVKKGSLGGEGVLTEDDRWSHVEYFPKIDVMCPHCH
ncbi:hypothetical protein N7G274_001163 [Stereocaulon virgatum]|uniref:Uncharacterized protein n=1 Tax=Stereocaulon virgatum TaxID=373712 RepID=A0ABR4AN26_9LECA